MPKALGKRARLSEEEEALAITSSAPTRSTRSTRHKGEQQSSPFVIVSDHEQEENPFVTPTNTRSSKRRRTAAPKAVEFDDVAYLENTPPKKDRAIKQSCRPDNDASSLPTTPRHRDRGTKIAITPRHRIGLLSRPLTPQSLRTPLTPRQFPSIYNEARKVFRTSIQTGKIIGREKEREEFTSFVGTRLKSKTSGCIYISGPPGTGKSALINQLSAELLEDHVDVRFSYCNCMSVKSATDIFSKLFDDFGVADVLRGTEMEELRNVFHSKQQAHLVILDEIDHLLDVDLDLLYQLFEWSMNSTPRKKSSSLVLVGIANALDLTDRFLPRLKAKNLKPHLLPFFPYSVAEISSVISGKLKSLLPDTTSDYVPFIHPMAIQFLSKKVAAQSGDIRKAFAICLRALDLIESETLAALTKASEDIIMDPTLISSTTSTPTREPLRENPYLSSPSAIRANGISSNIRSPTKKGLGEGPMAHLKPETAPRATIAHVAKVTAAAFGNGAVQRLAAQSLQGKAALCALAVLNVRHAQPTFDQQQDIGKKKSVGGEAAPTVKELYAEYAKLCTAENALPAALTRTEFKDVLEGLETTGLVSFTTAGKINMAVGTPPKRGRPTQVTNVLDKRVVSCVGVRELKSALSGGPGAGVLKAMMAEGLLLD